MTLKEEYEAVKKLGDEIGYGQLMSLATLCWRDMLRESNYPTSGAFIGECFSKDSEESIRQDKWEEFIKKEIK
jgi:hypothetical protein